MFFLHSHELIDRVKDLFLDSCPSIQLLLWKYLIDKPAHALCPFIPVSHCVSQNLVRII